MVPVRSTPARRTQFVAKLVRLEAQAAALGLYKTAERVETAVGMAEVDVADAVYAETHEAMRAAAEHREER